MTQVILVIFSFNNVFSKISFGTSGLKGNVGG